MPLTYHSVHSGFSYTFDEIGSEAVLLLDLSLERTSRGVLDRLRNVDPAVRTAPHVVLRGRGKSFTDVIGSEDLSSFFATASVHTLTGGLDRGTIILARLRHYAERPLPVTQEQLRASELEAIIRRNGALFGPSEHEHYYLPSGEHGEAFIRLGQALLDPLEVARVADWLLPKIGPDCGLIGDTGSILPLLLQLQNDALRTWGAHIPIRTADAYPGDPNMLRGIALDLHRELGGSGSIVFIVSVSSSGRVVRGILERSFALPHKLLVIVDTSTTNSDSLLQLPIARYTPDQQQQCALCEKRALIHIDSRLYERTYRPETVPILLTPAAASKNRDFWEAADRVGATHLHYDLLQLTGERRHYGIYVDVAALLGDSTIRRTAINALRDQGRPSIAIVPRHSGSEAVVDLLFQAFEGIEAFLFEPGNFDPSVVERIKALDASSSILVADDGLVTGSTLYNVRPQIHALFKQDTGMPSVKAFVVLARPCRKETIRVMKNRYRDDVGPQFSSAYQIYMPDHRSCPWCDEKSSLELFASDSGPEFASRANDRIAQLTGTLTPPILLGGDERDANSRSVGSFFGILKQPTGFAAAASAIYEQWIENVGEMDGPTGGGARIYYIDVARLINNYFADAFAPAVFRTMPARTLLYAPGNPELATALERLDPAQSFPCFVPELLWAVIQGKLPPFAAQLLLKKIDDPSEDIKMLGAMIQRQGL